MKYKALQFFAKPKIAKASLALTIACCISTSFAETTQLPTSDFSLKIDSEVSELLATPKYLWVSDKLDFKPRSKKTSDSFASKAELWSKSRWGLSGSLSKNDTQLFGVPKNSLLSSVNLNRQLLRSKNKTDYLALGIGWQGIDIKDTVEADGLTISLSGKYSVAKSFQLYGSSSWFHDLETNSRLQDIDGYNLEAGILFKTRSKLSFKAGYKVFDLEGDFNSSNSASFQLGTSLNF